MKIRIYNRQSLDRADVAVPYYTKDSRDKWSEKVFALPDVKEGSAIEYRYTFNLVVPPGYQVEEFPAPQRMALEDNSSTMLSKYAQKIVLKKVAN